MNEFLLAHASRLQGIDFFGWIVGFSLLEFIFPRRSPSASLRTRWFGNFSLLILANIVHVLFRTLVGIRLAQFSADRGWGLLNHFALPWWLGAILTLLALDLAVYAFHYLSHHVPFLWRLHRLHHTDEDVDFTTAVRIHPLDSFLGTGLQSVVFLMMGAGTVEVLITQLFLIFSQFLTHANLEIPQLLDRYIRWFLITPDMHRIHHSQTMSETNSNLGNVFPWWDRLLGTYIDQPAAGQKGMLLGLYEYRAPKHQRLPWMLVQPFLRAKSDSDVPEAVKV
jgi:sterol desaturase/sphingolipid hydroxylase (fatty acid hydroxylase superfamily)